MHRRKTTQYNMTAHFKEGGSIEEIKKERASLIMYLDRKAKREKWAYKGKFAISEHDVDLHEKVKVKTGVGRPRTEFRQRVKIENSIDGKYEIKPHLHIMIKARPGRTIAGDLKNYWEKKHGINTCSFRKADEEKEFGTSGWFNGYVEPQATSIKKSNYGYVGNFI